MSSPIAMPMARFRQVAAVWNWLPAFRAVAEHESIHGAATTLGISPSALSRTVKLLEDALSVELFFRHENGLKLTPMGAELLKMTRDAMRIVHDCIADQESVLAHGAGPLLIGVTSAIASAATTKALLEQQPKEPRVTFDVRAIAEEEVEDELLRGDLDVAVCFDIGESGELVAQRLGGVEHGVYASREHALSPRAGALGLDDLTEVSFVSCRSGDRWATGRPRKIAVFTDSLDVARALCEKTSLLCVVPDVLVNASTRLTRLCAVGPASPIYALRRKPLPSRNPALLDDFIGALERGLLTPAVTASSC